MSLVQQIKEAAARAISSLYGVAATAGEITVNGTKPEFEGDYTIVLFAQVKSLRKAPEALGNEIGSYLVTNEPGLFTSFNVIKGFLNLTLSGRVLVQALSGELTGGKSVPGRKVMVEYSSPNTNKPLHLGHLRNNFLGWSVAEILKKAGNEVMKTCIVNDRGVHICKSMIAWQLYGEGATPESTGTKGDHLVGDFYVRCENGIKAEAAELLSGIAAGNLSGLSEKDRPKAQALQQQVQSITGTTEKEKEKKKKLEDELKEIARANTPIMQKTQQMLLDWEQGKPEVIDLWKRMNGWVYEGFDATYRRIGTDFDKIYYESETYLLGKEFVERGLKSGVLYRKEDGSVWIDLTAEGLDEKLLLRRDGTSVYITQDLGLAQQKYEEFPYEQSIYVIADEQNYHMKVLQLILKKLGLPYADAIHHLSYGMVELPSGRMKSREGTVVDADDLVDEMVREAEAKVREHSRIEDFSEAELKELYETIGLGALKFFLLRVDPKKKMVFNPEESIEFIGFTGPYIQYTHARIRSILRKAGEAGGRVPEGIELHRLEKELLLQLEQFTNVVRQAASELDPSLIANYIFGVCKSYNTFNAELSVIRAESDEKKALRLNLCSQTAEVIREAMRLLGIRVPERM